MKTDFTKLPEGTRVWSLIKNECGFIEENKKNNNYPVKVIFDDGKTTTYTADGREYTYDKNASIFLQKFKIPEQAFEMPLPELAVDSKILVSVDPENICLKRYFSHWKDGKPFCFEDGGTSWSSDRVYAWDFHESTYYIMPEPKYIPYTATDLDKMSADDRVVRFKSDRYPILRWNKETIEIDHRIEDFTGFTYEYLLKNCTHIDEEKPFGKLVMSK